MWWGGLRGAVGFSLAMVLDERMWYRFVINPLNMMKVISNVKSL